VMPRGGSHKNPVTEGQGMKVHGSGYEFTRFLAREKHGTSQNENKGEKGRVDSNGLYEEPGMRRDAGNCSFSQGREGNQQIGGGMRSKEKSGTR